MKKLLSLLVLLVLVTTGLWAQFYITLPRAERKNLAEAYYLVSKQYERNNETQKASEFEAMAYNIDPGLNPNDIQVRDLPSAVALILEGRAKLAAVPKESAEAIEALLRSKFLRLVSAFLSENTPAMLELMDGSVYLSDMGSELTQRQIEAQLDAFFSGIDLTGLVPSQVYDLNSLTVRPLVSAAAAWGETYAVRIRAKMDFSKSVSFWQEQQQYLMHRAGSGWLIFSIGQKVPPASWSPKAAPKAPRRLEAVPQEGPQKEIKANLLACLEAFLDKDADRASGYFTEQVKIIRLDVSLTREEIAQTFQGYFESKDFSGIGAEDIVEADSVFVSPTDRFGDQSAGEEYLLTVKTQSGLDLSADIPFWTRFQDYYFAEQGGVWRIFAIF
jgi:hypothetical protein